MIGGSSIIIMDEPSRGMDPSAKRLLWWGRQYFFRINTFFATSLFLYPLKKSANQRFTNVLRGIEKD